MTKAIIIDDDIRFANIFREIVLKKCLELEWPVEVTATDRPADVLDTESHYDIYFIDISMPEMMGIDLAKKLNEQFVYREFVFVSAYSCYMQESIFVRPRAFIRKENLEKDLDDTLIILKNILRQSEEEALVKDNLREVRIVPAKIVYVKSDEHYLTLLNTEGEKLVIRNRLDNLEEQLRKFGFLRIHSRYLVNLNYLEDCRGHSFLLPGHISLPVSRSYRKRVNNAVMNWLTRDGA